MSTLLVTEFKAIAVEVDGHVVQIPMLPAIKSQKVAFTGTAGAIANAVDDECQYIQITVDAAAYFLVSTAPTALTDGTSIAISSEQQLFYGIPKAASLKVSAIAR